MKQYNADSDSEDTMFSNRLDLVLSIKLFIYEIKNAFRLPLHLTCKTGKFFACEEL